MKLKFQTAIAISIAGLVALTGCKTDDAASQETIEAEDIAEREGVAEPGATPDDIPEITAELLLQGDEDVFDSVDRDRNRLVDRDEFEDISDRADIFGYFDVNEDRKLGEEEFHAVLFEVWDYDDTGFVGPGEYLIGALNWFPEDTEELENFADIDADDDGLLSRGEFIANMDDIELFDRWDLEEDAKIAQDKLAATLLTIWDVDEDQMIGPAEWGGPKPAEGAIVAGITTVPVTVTVPSERIGTIVTGETTVTRVISDRGFYVENGDTELFTVVREDVPKKEMIDIDKGDRLQMTGILLDSEKMDLVAGELEKDAKEAIEKHGIFLSVYHGQVKILEEGGDESASL